MKAEKFVTVVTAAAPLFEPDALGSGAFDLGLADAFARLAQLLKAHELKTVKRIADTAASLEPVASPEGDAMMADLADALERVGALVEAIGSKPVAADMALMIEMARRHGAEAPAPFFARLETALTAKAAKPKKAQPPVDEALVDAYLHQLEENNFREAAFADVIARLKKDKAVRAKQEATAIANRFYGVELSYKSKAHAIETIERRHKQDNRTRKEDRAFAS